MSLRARVLIGLISVAVALAMGLVLLVHRQRGAELAVMDARLQRVQATAPGSATPRPAAGTLAGVFVGSIGDDGTITVLNPLGGDPTLEPQLPAPVDAAGGPFTVATSGPADERMRVVVVPRNGQRLVIGFSLAELDAGARTLAANVALLFGLVCIVLAIVAWQVLRLGVRPLRLTGEYAEAVIAGGAPPPLPDFAPGTEADRMARAFQEAIRQERRAVDRLEAFVADTSHELLNPLSTITGYAQLFLAGTFTDRAATLDAMTRIDDETRRIGRTVEGLAMLSLAGEQPARTPQRVDVSVLVADLCLDLTAIHPDRPVRVDVDTDLFIHGDPDLVVQVASALIRNALQHTDPSVALTVSVKPAAGPSTVGTVRIEVTDEGPGISETHLPHLFDRFYRIGPTTGERRGGGGRGAGAGAGAGDNGGGVGLGLAIVASVTEAMHGRYGVTSGPGGSTFWLEFPRAAPDVADPRPPNMSDLSEGTPTAHRGRSRGN